MSVIKSFDLQGRRALITGASRGIGRAIALALAEAGADVVIHHHADLEDADRTYESVQKLGREATVVEADLADDDAPQRLVEAATSGGKHVDILVLNASIQYRREWSQIARDEFDRQIRVNLRASLELMQLLGPAMVERQWGRILTIGSVQQIRPQPQMLPYGATKAAQFQLVMNLARQMGPGVTVNNLSPGVMVTDRNRDVLSDKTTRERLIAAIPAARFGQPDDCAAAALLICSNAGAYITGIDLQVDGGLHIC